VVALRVFREPGKITTATCYRNLRFFTQSLERNCARRITIFARGFFHTLKTAAARGNEAEPGDVVVPGAGPRRLKYYIHDHSHSFRLQLLGYLGVQDLAELEGCWQTAKPSVVGRKIRLDLLGLAGADEAGQQWLADMAESKEVELFVSAEAAGVLGLKGNVETAGTDGSVRASWTDRFKAWTRTGRKSATVEGPGRSRGPDRAVDELRSGRAGAAGGYEAMDSASG
jgi:hypothetical protein